MSKRVEVAAGVLLRSDGSFLLGQRAPGSIYAGYWEFPGGKIEAGETPAQALCRELEEELDIRVSHLRPWLRREHFYEHAHVCLHFFEVAAWSGELHSKVHHRLHWQQPGEEPPAPMLPANGPVLKALRLPRMMGITQAATIGVEAQLQLLDRALAGGLRLVQVREPLLDERRRRQLGAEIVRRVRACGGLVLINGDVELALELGADGVHLPAHQLMRCEQRPSLPWVGASTHDRAELEQAARLELDYALLGAVQPTASHPGAEGLGWPAFARLVENLPLPVLALGGMRAEDMARARDHGAHGIAAIRAAWNQPAAAE